MDWGYPEDERELNVADPHRSVVGLQGLDRLRGAELIWLMVPDPALVEA